MKAYYINLDRAVERRKHMEAQAAALVFDLVRVEAVDGRQLSSEDASKYRPGKGRTHVLSEVEVACFLSHRKAWQLIADGEQSHGLVLEDDLFLSSEFGHFANSTQWIPADCDIVKVETIGRPLLLRRPKFNVLLGRSLWRMGSENMGGGGYILSRSAAAALIDQTKTFVDPVDCVLFHPASKVWENFGVYQLDPALCVQQVRSKAVFLDASAAASQMDGARGTEKRKGVMKIFKEISRPFEQAFFWIFMCAKAIAIGGRFGSVKLK
ncbi:MAG: glycosyltransferase family 25 protein [Rhizobiaceae bacterium]